FLHQHRAHRNLLSFPTRRSSDLLLRTTPAGWGIRWAESSLRKKAAFPKSGWVAAESGGRTRPPLSRPGKLPDPNRAEAAREYYPDRKSTRLNSSHLVISYAVFCL